MIKVVKDAQNNVIAYGQDDDNFVPNVPAGATLSVVSESEIAALLAPIQAQIMSRNLADESAKTTAIANPVIQYLVDHTPEECSAYVGQALTGLPAPLVALMQHYSVALCVLSKDKLRA